MPIQTLIAFAMIVILQQCYARTHEYGVEQPIGIFGIADYLFRHPETLFGLRFNYRINDRQ